MFRGRQANPCSNKFLYGKQLEARQKAHRERLQRMKPAIDNRAPKKPRHLTNNKKREQMLEDRFLRIERENKLLLEKMSFIMSKSTLDNSNDLVKNRPFNSLNKSYRKKELQRITLENEKILRRIQQREPHYNHQVWEEERKTHVQYMHNICEFPVRNTGKKAGNRRGEAGPGNGSGNNNQSRAGLIPSLDASYRKHSRERMEKSVGQGAGMLSSPSAEGSTSSSMLRPLQY